jgi:predicted enzyme related to lactoylglutathione lyase
MNKVVHFEIPVSNMETARQFYAGVFGWQLQDWPMPDGTTYVGVRTVPVDEATRIPTEPGAINGGLIKRAGEAKAPIITLNVDSIDEHLSKISAAGGRLVKGKEDVLGMGFHAYVADPEGNVLGLWEDAKK